MLENRDSIFLWKMNQNYLNESKQDVCISLLSLCQDIQQFRMLLSSAMFPQVIVFYPATKVLTTFLQILHLIEPKPRYPFSG